jgi:hypothetical protein
MHSIDAKTPPRSSGDFGYVVEFHDHFTVRP